MPSKGKRTVEKVQSEKSAHSINPKPIDVERQNRRQVQQRIFEKNVGLNQMFQ